MQKQVKERGGLATDKIVIEAARELLEEFKKIVVKPYYAGDVDKAICDLLLQEIHERKGTTKFHDGVKWNIPKDTFILFALPRTEWRKLEKWQKRKHGIIIHLGAHGEVLLLNEEKLVKLVAREGAHMARKAADLRP